MGYRGGDLVDLFDPEPFLTAGRRTADRCQDELLRLVRRFTPVDETVYTGIHGDRARVHIRDTWEKAPVIQVGPGVFRVEVFTRHPDAAHVEYPTRPHLITPREDRAAASVLETQEPRRDGSGGAPALAFRRNGETVFATYVNHPGTQGEFMMHKAIAALRKDWERIGERELKRAFREARVT